MTGTNVIKGFFEQSRIINALILKELRTRFGNKKLGLIWIFIEPLLHIAVLLIIKLVILGRGGMDPEHYVLFVISGLIPFFVISKTYTRVMSGAEGGSVRAMLIFPMINMFDVALTRAVFEMVSQFLVLTVILFGLFFWGFDFEFNYLFTAILFFPLFAFFGLGFGVLLRGVVAIFPNFGIFVRAMNRLLYLTSGIIIPIDQRLSDQMLEYASYNPITHLLECFRDALFVHHDALSLFLNWQYAFYIGAVSLILGTMIEKRYMHRILANDE